MPDNLPTNPEPTPSQKFLKSLSIGFGRYMLSKAELEHYTQLLKEEWKLSLPNDKRIVTEAIQAARKTDTEAGELPSNQDIKMFCLGAKWMREFKKEVEPWLTY